MKTIRKTTAVLCAACLAAGVSSASASLYNANTSETGDTNVMSGAAIFGASGDIWNAYQVGWYTYGSDSYALALQNSSGNPTGMTLSIGNYVTGYTDYSGGTAANPLNLMGGISRHLRHRMVGPSRFN